MHIYRALNKSDIKLNPIINGLINKKAITLAAEEYYYLMAYYHNYNVSPEEEKYIIKTIKEEMPDRLKFQIEERISEEQNKIDKALELIKNNDYDEQTEKYLRTILGTINLHLRKGSTNDTKWISCSKTLEKTLPYYLKEEESSKIAIIDSNTNGVFDGDLLALDLSTKENIEKLKDILISKNMHYTKKDFVGFKYATHSSEVVYFNHIPNGKIKSILSPFEIDLFLNDAVSQKIFDYSPVVQLHIYKQIKENLKELVNQHTDLIGLFEAMYEQELSLDNIKDNYDISNYELIKNKKKILSLVNEMNHNFITPIQNKIKVAEEYK